MLEEIKEKVLIYECVHVYCVLWQGGWGAGATWRIDVKLNLKAAAANCGNCHWCRVAQLHTAHCTLHIAHCTKQSVRIALIRAHIMMHTVPFDFVL